MNKNLQEPTVRVSARRRLVRGVFAAPAALSLYSGSTFAATSISCVAKDVAARQEPPNSLGTDTYIRVRLYNMTKNGATTRVIGWIKGADLTALNAPTTYLTSSQWQVYSVVNPPSSPPFTVGQIIGFQPTAANWTFNPTANGAYVAVRVDASGNIKGVVGLSGYSQGYAVHKSCWASVRPGP